MDLETKKTELLTNAKALIEKDGATAEDVTKANAMIAEAETLTGQMAARSALADIETRSAAGSNRKTAPSAVTFDKKELRSYSLLRALQLRAAGKELDGVERQVSDYIEKRSGRPLSNPSNFYVPLQALETRALDLSNGTGSVGVNLVPEMIELLRNKLVIAGLGATILTDMQGKFSLPKQTGGATAYWLTEGNSPTGTQQTVGQVAFVPKTVGAFTDITRSFMQQSSVDAENFVRNDLAAVLARAIDQAAINGSGSSGQPQGIIGTAGIGSVAGGTNGLAPTWDNMVALETAVRNANVDGDKLAYLSNSKVVGKLKTTPKVSGQPIYLIDADRKLNGYDVAVTNAVPSNLTKGSASGICSAAIFGNWSDLVIAMFGGIEINVDPYSLSTSGGLRVVALQDLDIQVRQAGAFAACLDLLTT